MAGTKLKWNRFGATIIVGASLAICAEKVCGDEKKNPAIDRIQDAWQARQDRIRTARLEWTEKRTWPKGSISFMFGPGTEERVPEAKGKIMPPEDATVGFSCSLVLKNDQVRYEYDGHEWDHGIQGFRPVNYASAFDGETAKDLYPLGVGFAQWPIGVVRKGPEYPDAALAVLKPLFLLYRPFAPKFHPTNLHAMELGDERVVVDGISSIELVERLPLQSSIHLWVDPARDFVMLRRLIIEKGQPFQQIDVRYKDHGKMGWVPTDWKIVAHNPDGGVLCSTTALATNIRFDLEAPAESFAIDFPPGARVQDEKNQENYIVRTDGSKRTILSTDIGATYEQMLGSSPGEALQRESVEKPKPRWKLLIIVFMASAVGYVIVRRLRLKKDEHTSA